MSALTGWPTHAALHIDAENIDGQWTATARALPGWRAIADTWDQLATLVAEAMDFMTEELPALRERGWVLSTQLRLPA